MTLEQFVTAALFAFNFVQLFVICKLEKEKNELWRDCQVEKKMNEVLEHQLDIAEKEIMRRDGLDQMKDTYIKIQKQEKELMKWQAEQGGGY